MFKVTGMCRVGLEDSWVALLKKLMLAVERLWVCRFTRKYRTNLFAILALKTAMPMKIRTKIYTVS